VKPKTRQNLRRLTISALLGTATWAAISATEDWLPNSIIKDAVLGSLALPGYLLASLAYPEGIHSGHGSKTYPIIATLMNIAIYGSAWQLIWTWANWRTKRKHTGSA
jgi:hypothetical protein